MRITVSPTFKRRNMKSEGVEEEVGGSVIDSKIRKAAKGLRQPILGELPSDKILQDYSRREKKGAFFCCC